jgi:integrase
MSTQIAVMAGGQLSPLAVIDRLDRANSTKTKYKRALANYLETGGSLTDAEALARYAETLPASGRAFLKAAVGHIAEAIAGHAKGQATPENVSQVQATLYRAEALQGAIQVEKAKGQKAHTWLSQRQVKALLDSCGDDLEGQRDRLVLGLLVAAGLRREEAANLRFEDVKQQPLGDQFRTVLAVRGKGAKDRVVPISDGLARAIDAWGAVVGGQGYIVRALGRDRRPRERLSPVGIFNIVRKRGAMIGKPELAPHDLRRTYAQLGYEAGVPITQISRLLGHATIATTQRYLNLDLDLESTISDFIPF